MVRRTTFGALVLSLLVLSASSGEAKWPQPSQVVIHDLRTGTTTLLDSQAPGEQDEPLALPKAFRELAGLMGLLGDPSRSRAPQAVSSGKLEHVATLTWRLDDGTTSWVDRVFSDGVARTWVERTDHLYATKSVSWGQVEAAFAFDVVLSVAQGPAEDAAPPVPASTTSETRQPGHQTSARETSEQFDASSFGWGAGLAGVLAAGVVLTTRWRRQRSVTASRNARASSAASS